MAKGILGIKVGMTQIFDANGNLVPVTVLECMPNVVVQQKTMETDGYLATQVAVEDKKESLATKPEQGHFSKASTTPKRFVKEIRFENLENEMASLAVGHAVTVESFQEGEAIDVCATSKGKGFAGTIKRYNHSTGPMQHGSGYHRGIGSMGAIKGNMKGKKMPGHMGAETVTIHNLEVVKVIADKNVLLVKGNVPGPKKGLVTVTTAIKSKK